MSQRPTLAHSASEALHAETKTDTLARAEWRVGFMFDAFYDVSPDPDEADQPFRDLLADLAHIAERHDVDLYIALDRALWMKEQEVTDWAARDATQTTTEGAKQ